MEAESKIPTLDQAASLLEDSTIFKLKFMEGILMELACSENRIELSGAAYQGWYLIMEEIRKEVEQADKAICHHPKEKMEVAA